MSHPELQSKTLFQSPKKGSETNSSALKDACTSQLLPYTGSNLRKKHANVAAQVSLEVETGVSELQARPHTTQQVDGGQDNEGECVPGQRLSGKHLYPLRHLADPPPFLRPLGSRHKGAESVAVAARALFTGAVGKRDTGFTKEDRGRISRAPFPHGASVWVGRHGRGVAGEPRPAASRARVPWRTASTADGLLCAPPSAGTEIGGAPW